MNSFLAIAWNGYREARRNRVTVVVGVFLALLLASSQIVTDTTVSTFVRVLKDFGLSTMSLILVFLAIFLGTGLLSRDIERRTIYLIVSKPVSRSTFLLGRIAGNMITLAALMLAMAVLFVVEVKLYGAQLYAVDFLALLGLLVELFVLTSVSAMMSSFAGTTVSAVVVVGVYLLGHLSPDIYKFGERSESLIGKALWKLLYVIVPNLERLNFRPQATYGVHVTASSALSNLAYGLGWGILFLAIGAIIFNRRDFK